MVQAVNTSLTKTSPPFRWDLTKMAQSAWTKTGQAVRWVVTKTGQAVRWVATKIGEAVTWVLTKVGQFLAWLADRLYSGRRKLYQERVRTQRRYLGGGVAGKPQSSGSPVSSETRDHRIDIRVDNDEERQVLALKASPVGEDEAKSTEVVNESSTLPMAVREELPMPSYKEVVRQRSPVMIDALSALSAPEQPRWGRLGRYDGGQRILLVGEGDFSFSACLAAAFGDASNMVATSLDTFGFLEKNYKKAPENIKELKRRGCKVIHQVDATKMANHPKLCSTQFDRIIYNFPYWGFSILNQPREVQISYHQSLVLGFMENAKEMIGADGEIHITHKSVGFSKDWNIVQLGWSEGLELVAAVQFKLQKYPGYCTKYGFGGDGDFDCHPSKTYMFKLAPKTKLGDARL